MRFAEAKLGHTVYCGYTSEEVNVIHMISVNLTFLYANNIVFFLPYLVSITYTPELSLSLKIAINMFDMYVHACVKCNFV